MKSQKWACLAFGVLLAGVASSAQAQIGTGWTRYYPEFDIHRQGSGTYSKSGTTETFKITNVGVVGQTGERSEIRLHNNYWSGQRQFQGYLKVIGGNRMCLKQTMIAGGTAWFMMSVKSTSGGQLYDHGNSGAGTFMSSVYGKTIRVNTVHNRSGNRFYLYLDGALKYTRTTGASTFNEKYGAYKTLSGTGPTTVTWTDVRLWRK